MCDHDAARECLEAQVAELELLATIEADAVVNPALLQVHLDACRTWCDAPIPGRPPELVVAFHLLEAGPVFRDGRIDPSATVRSTIEFRLPTRYPREAPPSWFLECPSVVKAEGRAEVLCALNATVMARAPGTECLHALLETGRSALLEVLANIAEDDANVEADRAAAAAADGTAALAQLVAAERVLGRRCVYFHHILCTGKRQCIAGWARMFGINGFAKVGYPGILIVEGPECAVEEYVRWLQRLRWKLMVVRGEERVTATGAVSLDTLRVIPGHGVIEIGESSTIAEHCRELGLEQLFLTSMKKYR